MRRTHKLLAIPLIAGLVLTPLAAPAVQAATPATQVTPQSILAEGATSVQMQTSDNGTITDTNAGINSRTWQQPIENQSKFRGGSTTKMFIATALLKLSEEGKVNLDAPVEQYLPGAVGFGGLISVRQLLNQTSGLGTSAYENLLPYDPETLLTKEGTEAFIQKHYKTEDLVAYIDQAGLTVPTGTWTYSNANFILAGEVIRAVTGMSYNLYIQKEILTPLGMRPTTSLPTAGTSMTWPHAAAYQPSEFYSTQPGGEPIELTKQSPTMFGASGGIVTTTGDLNKFTQALFSGKIISQASLAEMYTTGAENPLQYGLGLMQYQTSCGTVRGHSGNVYGYTTAAYHLNGKSVSVGIAEGTAIYASHSASVITLALSTLCPTDSASLQQQAEATARETQ